ncbi:hypothetical protein [Pseudosulfitobacter pseudonitzschiae]|uniref:hypothetical protein n=1 Tax=Pseudosulfitobacter pseudonitzschiae TaxID=1402135 RepID=UPI001CCE49E8|nr:hypothetical protein [Pseudosulfitobacter pseudonitzschiae]MBM1865880.1 hypothetical protein [Pseudosulfitobacter pseudonitzschiae]MBM1946748.1 hypothetical protein [Pseudosulfitobacter pseudonitzschiae]MBM1961286.1 hypothetical protein [Pseudosulfitobacter pseudonitzschiae]MBM1966061.1 hypothetical protein [Pseudosulfitobacter pseudonitzschiae]MBM2015396.1 hypothetical protein [Pseudosulfitobacter pseudonitzschiae]
MPAFLQPRPDAAEARTDSDSAGVRPKERPAAAVPATGARTVADFDTVSAEEKAAATAAPAKAGARLGVTVASLGSPSEPGLWLKTPLVKSEQPGRVTFAGSGKSVAVTLIPIDGPATGGSRMSLSAFQTLEAPLTGLPQIEVFTAS